MVFVRSDAILVTRAAGGEPFTDEQKAQMEELIANLERAKAQTWEEKQKVDGAAVYVVVDAQRPRACRPHRPNDIPL